MDYLLPPNDVYYTYIHCDQCASQWSYVREVHVAMRFPVACDQPVDVSFVAASGDTACLMPDTLHVLSGAVTFHLTATEPGDYDFALPGGVFIGGDAFLRVNFTVDGAAACSAIGTRPQLLTTNSCVGCRSWNDSVAGRQDLCHVLLPGQPVMYAIVDACSVPARRNSWGSLKLLYR